MLINKLKSKIHRARITRCNVNYNGSLSLDASFMELSGIHEYEKILIANLSNGQRFETYAIKEEKGSKTVGLNGAAARLGEEGDIIIILAFGLVKQEKAESLIPKIIVMDEHNNPTVK